MTVQLDILVNIFKNRLKKILFLIVPLVALTPLDAKAFPVFCSDIAFAPDQVLTGYQFDVAPANLPDDPPRAIAVMDSAPCSIDEMLSRIPKNRQLFHVGREALIEDRDEKKEDDSSAGVTGKQTASAAEANINSSAATSEFLIRDEHWYYMNIDQDGTYLFFGDMLEEDESTTGMGEDDFHLDGIGIGKKWRF